MTTHAGRGMRLKLAMPPKESSSQQTLFACGETVLYSFFQPGVVLIFRWNSSLAVLRHPTELYHTMLFKLHTNFALGSSCSSVLSSLVNLGVCHRSEECILWSFFALKTTLVTSYLAFLLKCNDNERQCLTSNTFVQVAVKENIGKIQTKLGTKRTDDLLAGYISKKELSS